MNPLLIKLIIGALVVIASFGAGWRVKGAFVAEGELAAQQARAEMIATVRAEEGRVAALVEDRLKELRANERTIEREKLKIIENPVYRNVCLDNDGLRLIERARAGKAAATEPTGEVPPAE